MVQKSLSARRKVGAGESKSVPIGGGTQRDGLSILDGIPARRRNSSWMLVGFLDRIFCTEFLSIQSQIANRQRLMERPKL